MFDPVSPQIDFPASEAQVRRFWQKRGIQDKAQDRNRGADSFVFYEGPPTANGMPHPGHCLTRAVKDIFPRYRTMLGQYCERKGGWDTHGLPVEVEVCKELGIHSKEEIEAYGMEPFIQKCQQSVFRYVKEWEEATARLGFWVDLEEAYVTYHQSYVESVWWCLKTFFDAGLLYQGHKIVWWWAQGGTALSAGEVGQGYREVADPSVYVKLPLVDEPEVSLLIWTTTPWTLPSNTFCAVKDDLEYALVRDAETDERLYIASGLVDAIAGKTKRELTVESTCRGRDLVGRHYTPPFDFYAKDLADRRATLKTGGEQSVAWRVLSADFVTTESGTGLVHVAPAFGEADYELMQQEATRFVDPAAVPLLCAVEPDGKFGPAVSEDVQGLWVKDADKLLTRKVKEAGLLYHQDQILHDYPFCWRADQDPLIQYPRRSWFVRTTQFVDDLVANNQEINWLPEHIKDGRFGKFLEGNVDWTLSRERYWGTPLPIWVCSVSGQMEAIGSYDELLGKTGVTGTEVWAAAKEKQPDLCEDLKIHKPYIDAVTYASPFAEDGRMERVSEVIDCWFDSGSMPFAQWGFPHKNKDRFLAQFPADFISEALDQTRGWFYSLLSISTLLFGKNGVAASHGGLAKENIPSAWPQPYANCVVLGLLLGEDGLKMSKSKKNYRSPDHIFDSQGADAMRWLFFSGNPPWTSILFQDKAITEGQRDFLIKLYNVYSFFVSYANIDSFESAGDFTATPDLGDGATELDRWLLSEVASTTQEVRRGLDAFDSFGSSRRLGSLVDSLSNWYVRRSRERFWQSGMSLDKVAAYRTLHHTLVQVALLSAPYIPFFSETLYQNLVRTQPCGEGAPESVHLCDYPAVDEAAIDPALSSAIARVREVTSLGHAVRAQSKIKVRQPLSLAEVVLPDQQQCDELRVYGGLIAEELNVKQVQFSADADEYVNYVVKPNFRSMGPKFGKLAKSIQKTLGSHPDPASLRQALESDGNIKLEVDGTVIELDAEDVQIGLTAKDGWAAAQGRAAVVVLKTEISEELLREGLARELMRHVQNQRKELDLDYEQRIALGILTHGRVAEVALEFGETIARETLATEYGHEPVADGTATEVEVAGESVVIWMRGL